MATLACGCVHEKVDVSRCRAELLTVSPTEVESGNLRSEVQRKAVEDAHAGFGETLMRPYFWR